MKLARIALAAGLLGSVALPAFAADLPSNKSAPAFVDDSFDPFLVRVRALGVVTDASGTTLSGNTLYGAKLQDNVVPEADLTYFITKHWAVEAIAGVAHTRLTANVIPGNVAIANTTLLPPTVTLQYHFALGQLDPYVGLGANYTWFLGTTSGPYNDSVNIHPAAGLALQAGFDYYLTKHWALNVDVKKIFLDSDANIVGLQNIAHINANPWLIGVGIGYRFGGSDAVVAKY